MHLCIYIEFMYFISKHILFRVIRMFIYITNFQFINKIFSLFSAIIKNANVCFHS